MLLFGKSEQFGQHAPFMSKDTLKHYVKNYIQSHAGNVVEFAWQGGEPALLGLDFYKQAVEYQQEFAQGKQINKRLSNQWALLLISNGLHFSNNIIF